MTTTKPSYCTDEHLAHLDDLHNQGVGHVEARILIRAAFPDLDREQANQVINYWCRITYSKGGE